MFKDQADKKVLQKSYKIYTRCKNIKTLQVPKSYKAPVFLEQLVAGLSDQGTVSLECKVVSDFWEGLQIGHFS